MIFSLWKTAFLPFLISGYTYNPYGDLCKELPYKTRADVIYELSSFSNLYIQYGNCAYSAQYSFGENQNRYYGGEKWYMGSQYQRGANVAYSLYGSRSSSFGRCSKANFINSFYTLDGLYSFAEATDISLKKVRSYTENTDVYYDQQTCSDAITCGDSDNAKNTFIVALFTDGICQPTGYAETINSLNVLNKELKHKSCVKISFHTALNLLTHSETCSVLSGTQCPDPHGILKNCQKKYLDFHKFLALHHDKDSTKNLLYGIILLILAFLIYGFALLKKQKNEIESNNPLMLPRSFENTAMLSAQTIGMVSQKVLDHVYDELEQLKHRIETRKRRRRRSEIYTPSSPLKEQHNMTVTSTTITTDTKSSRPHKSPVTHAIRTDDRFVMVRYTNDSRHSKR